MTKKTINRYRQIRDDLGWSREYAADKLGMSDDKLERIENDHQMPNPQDVLIMSDVYHAPELCNHYCNGTCEIGQKYVPKVDDQELPSIILGLLNSIYAVGDIEKMLVRITADNVIDDDEIPELVKSQYTLEQLSVMIEALQLCIERKIDNGEITKDIYDKEWKKQLNADK
ncbi:MAG: helix-turn-helix transcriptional regulator [Firmicutes bacterium]|nr:helix-turn-helix transcriptional regulator [Bacillota bacterium]